MSGRGPLISIRSVGDAPAWISTELLRSASAFRLPMPRLACEASAWLLRRWLVTELPTRGRARSLVVTFWVFEGVRAVASSAAGPSEAVAARQRLLAIARSLALHHRRFQVCVADQLDELGMILAKDDLDRSLPLTFEAVAIARDLARSDAVRDLERLTLYLDHLTIDLRDAKRPIEEIDARRELRVVFSRLADLHPRKHAVEAGTVHRQLADCLRRLERLDEAEREAVAAVDTLRATLATHGQDAIVELADAIDSLAAIYHQRTNMAKARDLRDEAIAMLRDLGPEGSDTARTLLAYILGEVGADHAALGDLDLAVETRRAAVQLREDLSHEEPSNRWRRARLASARLGLGNALRSAELPREGEAELLRCVEDYRWLVSIERPRTRWRLADALDDLGRARIEAGEDGGATDAFGEALTHYDWVVERFTDARADRANCAARLARVAGRLRRSEVALAAVATAVADHQILLDQEGQTPPRSWAALASAIELRTSLYATAGRAAEAVVSAEEAVVLLRREMLRDIPAARIALAHCLWMQATFLHHISRSVEALALLEAGREQLVDLDVSEEPALGDQRDREIVRILIEQACVFYHQVRRDEALQVGAQAVAQARKLDTSLSSNRDLLILALSLHAQHGWDPTRPAATAALLEEAKVLREASEADEQSAKDRLGRLNREAQAHAAIGRHVDARRVYSEAMQVIRTMSADERADSLELMLPVLTFLTMEFARGRRSAQAVGIARIAQGALDRLAPVDPRAAGFRRAQVHGQVSLLWSMAGEQDPALRQLGLAESLCREAADAGSDDARVLLPLLIGSSLLMVESPDAEHLRRSREAVVRWRALEAAEPGFFASQLALALTTQLQFAHALGDTPAELQVATEIAQLPVPVKNRVPALLAAIEADDGRARSDELNALICSMPKAIFSEMMFLEDVADRRELLRPIGRLASLGALHLARTGRTTDAVELLDTLVGWELRLARAADSDRATRRRQQRPDIVAYLTRQAPPGWQSPRAQPRPDIESALDRALTIRSLAEIRARASDAAVVFVLCAADGGAALVLAPDAETELIANDLSFARLGDAIMTALRPATAPRGRLLLRSIVREHILPTLADVQEHAAAMTVIPVGIAGFLPIYAEAALANIPIALAARLNDNARVAVPGDSLVVHSASSEEADLPGARAEVAALASRVGAQPLQDPDASPERVLSQMRQATFVHLACHARYSFNPLKTALVFGGQPLELSRLWDHLDSHPAPVFAALNVCDSASPELDLQEQMVGLASTFTAHGTRTVLANVWAVSDSTAAAVADAFYAHWQTGIECGAALDAALHEHRARLPLDTSVDSFALYGDRHLKLADCSRSTNSKTNGDE